MHYWTVTVAHTTLIYQGAYRRSLHYAWHPFDGGCLWMCSVWYRHHTVAPRRLKADYVTDAFHLCELNTCRASVVLPERDFQSSVSESENRLRQHKQKQKT